MGSVQPDTRKEISDGSMTRRHFWTCLVMVSRLMDLFGDDRLSKLSEATGK